MRYLPGWSLGATLAFLLLAPVAPRGDEGSSAIPTEASSTAIEDLIEALTQAGEDERAALLEASDLDREQIREALQARGQEMRTQSRFAEALALLELALGLSEQRPAGERAGLLTEIGTARVYLGDLTAAAADLRSAQTLAEQARDKGQIGRAMFQLSFVSVLEGDYERAKEQAASTLALAEETGDAALAAKALNGLGSLADSQGELEQALDYYQRSLAFAERVGEPRAIGVANRNMAYLHLVRGDYRRAYDALRRSLAVAEAGEDYVGLTFALQHLALVYAAQGDNAQAARLLERGLRIAEERGMKPRMVQILVALAEVYRRMGRGEEATAAFERCLAGADELGEKRAMAFAFGGQGDLFYERGDYGRALESFQAARRLAQEMGSKDLVAAYLAAEARTLLVRRDASGSLKAADEAAELARAVGAPVVLSSALYAAGLAQRAMGRTRTAARLLYEATAVIEGLREEAAGGEEERQRFLEDKLGPYHELVDLHLAAGEVAAAFAVAERAKGRVLLEVLQGRRASLGRSLTDEERGRERRLLGVLRDLNAEVYAEAAKGEPDEARLAELRARQDQARLEYEAFRTSLHAAHPELRLARGEIRSLELADAAPLIPDERTALLEYVVTEGRTYLFVLTRDQPDSPVSARSYRLDVDQETLGQRVAGFRQRLARRDLDYHDEARELHDLLLKPAAGELRGRTTLGLVPDGVLWELPFQALQTAAGRHLLEDHAIFYVPSLGVLREMRERRRAVASAAPTLLALGNPRLDAAARGRAGERGLALGDLPDADDEVARLRELYGDSRSAVYTGEAAREEVVKLRSGRYDVLHLAAHAVLDDASPLYSHILLTPGGGGPEAEDGLLEAWEVVQLDLGARLVVLSACHTAGGRVAPGEGMVGMSWAFFIAGSPATLASQWPVDSASTRELMVGFHRALLDGGGKARALRQAALSLLEKPGYRHPFYWAGFVLVGDGAGF